MSQSTSMSKASTSSLKGLYGKNLPFHILIEKEVEETPYGQITFNVEIVNGVVQLDTLNIVKNKRKRYKLTNK